MAKEKDTVWIGFMDIVPVIGTVKESVELVLAVYEEKNEIIKEKAEALKKFVKNRSKKHVKVSQTQYKPAGGAAEFFELGNMKEVQKTKIIEHVKKGSKNQNLTPEQQSERKRKLQEIRQDMVQKLKRINELNEFNEELKEQVERSNRGEHVFNNDILKFHSKVLKKFEENKSIELSSKLGKHTLCQCIGADIQYNMVVHFDPEEFYVNANAIVYSAYSKKLSEALLNVMCCINHSQAKGKKKVARIINYINNTEIYVDMLAKEKWINNNTEQNDHFQRVKDEVATMYKEKRGVAWCKTIMSNVAP